MKLLDDREMLGLISEKENKSGRLSVENIQAVSEGWARTMQRGHTIRLRGVQSNTMEQYRKSPRKGAANGR